MKDRLDVNRDSRWILPIIVPVLVISINTINFGYGYSFGYYVNILGLLYG